MARATSDAEGSFAGNEDAISTTICASFVFTFAQVAAFLSADFPDHKVLSGQLVQDASSASAGGCRRKSM